METNSQNSHSESKWNTVFGIRWVKLRFIDYKEKFSEIAILSVNFVLNSYCIMWCFVLCHGP